MAKTNGRGVAHLHGHDSPGGLASRVLCPRTVVRHRAPLRQALVIGRGTGMRFDLSVLRKKGRDVKRPKEFRLEFEAAKT